MCSANTSGAWSLSSSSLASSRRSSTLGFAGVNSHVIRPSNTCGFSRASNVILNTTVSPRSTRPERGSTVTSPSTPDSPNAPRSHA